jgi:hypothetical protein
VAHSSGGHFGCNIGEPSGVFKWPTQVVVILSAILGNQVGYLSGPLKWLPFWVQYWGTGDELHSLLFVYFHIFTPLVDDHVIAPHATDVT